MSRSLIVQRLLRRGKAKLCRCAKCPTMTHFVSEATLLFSRIRCCLTKIHASSARMRIAIIGSGISGIAAARTLQRIGVEAVVFERAGAIGGVWALAYP